MFIRITSVAAAGVLLGVMPIAGCSIFRGSDAADQALGEIATVPKLPRNIAPAVTPHGMEPMRVTGVGLVNSLGHGGGAPDPSPSRDTLLDDIKRLKIPSSEQLLESDSNALVQIEALIPPGARRGDVIDVRVIAPPSANVTDLRGGWLLKSRLTQQIRVAGGNFGGSNVRKGDVMANAMGLVLTDDIIGSNRDAAARTSGRVLRGATVAEDRRLGLTIDAERAHVATAKVIGDAINSRFFFFDGASRRGIATPNNDSFISLDVPPRYEHSLGRLIEVIGEISLVPGQSVQNELTRLSAELSDPATARRAAVRLEAIGEPAVSTLTAQIAHDDPEIRFYALTSLAYLDRPEAVRPLCELIRTQPAFRGPALLALLGMRDDSVDDGLAELLDARSAETRYAAMVILRRRKSPRLVGGGNRRSEFGSFEFYEVGGGQPDGAAAVVASARDQPEIVLFGQSPRVDIKTFLRTDRGLLVRRNGDADDSIVVDRFVPGVPDATGRGKATVSGLIRAAAATGAPYGDVLALLQSAHQKGVIEIPVMLDPLPPSMRTYHRETSSP